MVLTTKNFTWIYAILIQCIARTTGIFLASSLAPLIGYFSNVYTALFVYFIRTAWILIETQSTSLSFYLPTLSGTFYLSTQSRIAKAFIPALCVVLFLLHPIGSASWAYTVYWIAPIVLSFFSIKSIFLRSLASTLTTHAVGSVLWIYTHHTTTLYWHSLISIVWLERLTSALILTAGYYAIVSIQPILIYARQKGIQPQPRWGI